MVAQPRPARGAPGAAPVPVQVPFGVCGGTRTGSEPPGSGRTALTPLPPPQPGLLPVLLPDPPRSRPRPAEQRWLGEAGPAGAAWGRAGEPRGGPADPLSRACPGAGRGGGSAAGAPRSPAGRTQALAGCGARRVAGAGFQVSPPRWNSALWNDGGLKSCGEHRAQHPRSLGDARSSPHQFISLPQGPKSSQGPVQRWSPGWGVQDSAADSELHGGRALDAAEGVGLQPAREASTPRGPELPWSPAPSIHGLPPRRSSKV